MGLREINDKHPERHEYANRGEFHTLRNGPDDQGRGNDREHQLIHRKYILRHPVGIVRVRVGIHTFEEGKIQAAQEFTPAVKDQTVTAYIPKDRDQAGNEQTLGQYGQYVLAPHEAAVEQRQTREGHE